MLDYGRSATYMIPESFQQLIIHTPFFLFVRSYDYASPLSVFLVFGSKLDWARFVGFVIRYSFCLLLLFLVQSTEYQSRRCDIPTSTNELRD